ncbi:MAG TPA: mercury resistance system periplasmic binding protein MerP [Alphaproteobacteria bacterium]|jgi:mercuric ion binding protein
MTLAALLGTLAFTVPAMAAERTVTLAVENMTCVSCPYIVKRAMERVPGVSKVDVSYADKTAIVTFDDAKTTAEVIARASANVGYPARPIHRGG